MEGPVRRRWRSRLVTNDYDQNTVVQTSEIRFFVMRSGLYHWLPTLYTGGPVIFYKKIHGPVRKIYHNKATTDYNNKTS